MRQRKNQSFLTGSMVEHTGFEPVTSTMRMSRATEACPTQPMQLCSGRFDKLEFTKLFHIYLSDGWLNTRSSGIHPI